MKLGFILLAGSLGLSSCASYNYAQNLKMVSFDDNLQKGAAAGPIRGEDCTWSVLGYQMGGMPTLDKAFINAKNQAGTFESAGFSSGDKHSQAIRYVNNVSTATEGFNAGVVGKNCIVVKGTGYR